MGKMPVSKFVQFFDELESALGSLIIAKEKKDSKKYKKMVLRTKTIIREKKLQSFKLELQTVEAHHATNEFYKNWENAKTSTARSYWLRRHEVEAASIPHLKEEIQKFNKGEYNMVDVSRML